MFNIFPKTTVNEQKAKKISAYFIVIALIFSAVSFLLLLDNSKNYQVETSIIFIPKSEKAASDSEHIIENMAALPKKLSFYEKMIKDNKDIEDNFFGLSDEDKKEMWNKEIEAKREGNSSIVNISVIKNSPEEAKLENEAVVSTLFNIMSYYYNIKSDADFRIVDGPNVSTKAKNWFLIAILSLAIGAVISLVINFISSFISNYLLEKREGLRFKFDKSFFESKFLPKKDAGEKPEPEKIIEKAKEIKAAAPIQAPVKKSFAPENLPTAPGNLSFIDEDYFRTTIIKSGVSSKVKTDSTQKEIPTVPEEKQTATQKEETAANLHREPTQEELKKRLNQLLKGEL